MQKLEPWTRIHDRQGLIRGIESLNWSHLKFYRMVLTVDARIEQNTIIVQNAETWINSLGSNALKLFLNYLPLFWIRNLMVTTARKFQEQLVVYFARVRWPRGLWCWKFGLEVTSAFSYDVDLETGWWLVDPFGVLKAES